MSYNMTQYNQDQWDYVNYLIKEHKKVFFKFGFNKKKFIEYLFNDQMGYRFDINNPKTFNEKINAFKYNYKKKGRIFSNLTDKNKVREYVKAKIGEQYLIPQLLFKKKITVDDLEKLPNSFVIKTNNGSGTNYIVKDKSKEDLNKLCNYMNNLLKIKYQYIWGEFHYGDIKPGIVVDELKVDKEGNLPYDLKCFCFNNNGKKHKVYFIDRVIGDDRCRKWIDEDWNEIEIKSQFTRLDVDIKKPKNYKDIFRVIDILSEDFNFVRVDLFLLDNKIYFGELTFTPTAGYLKFDDDVTDKMWGEWIG